MSKYLNPKERAEKMFDALYWEYIYPLGPKNAYVEAKIECEEVAHLRGIASGKQVYWGKVKKEIYFL